MPGSREATWAMAHCRGGREPGCVGDRRGEQAAEGVDNLIVVELGRTSDWSGGWDAASGAGGGEVWEASVVCMGNCPGIG